MWGLVIVLSYAKAYQALLMKQNTGITNPNVIRVAPADENTDTEAEKTEDIKVEIAEKEEPQTPVTLSMILAGIYYAAHIGMAIYIVVEIGK